MNSGIINLERIDTAHYNKRRNIIIKTAIYQHLKQPACALCYNRPNYPCSFCTGSTISISTMRHALHSHLTDYIYFAAYKKLKH